MKYCMFILLTCSLAITVSASYVPLELKPYFSNSNQCENLDSFDIANIIETLYSMIKIWPPLPYSCMEIQASSPESPSGYYILNNGTGGIHIAYCNMNEYFSCSSIEQAFNALAKSHEETIKQILTSHKQASHLPSSCQEIKDKCPDCDSGVYSIAENTYRSNVVYCHMEKLCNITGPWTRVAYMNMSDPAQQCPSQLALFASNGVRGCGRKESSSGGCSESLYFEHYRGTYSQVCGRMQGLQYSTPNGVDSTYDDDSTHSSIDGSYVDGVSLTVGKLRQHVWTFMGSLQENFPYQNGDYTCPCADGSIQTPQMFIGNDYFCESGFPGYFEIGTLYTEDILWDGQQCGVKKTACCQVPGLPWFHKVLDAPTTEQIELRVCSDQSTDDENVPVVAYEVYVQ